MQTSKYSLTLAVLVASATLLNQTRPSSSAPIGGHDDNLFSQTTTSSIDTSADYKQQSQDEQTSNSTPTLPVGRFGLDLSLNVGSGYQDGSILVNVNRDEIELRIGYDRTITDVLAGDRNYIGRPLAEYYPALYDYLELRDLMPKSKQSEEVLALFRELDAQRLTSEAPSAEEFDDDEDEDEDESAKRCPICRNRLGDDNLFLDCQHEFHIRCIWDWKRKGMNTKCPVCRYPFEI